LKSCEILGCLRDELVQESLGMSFMLLGHHILNIDFEAETAHPEWYQDVQASI
jgi:hypothetical protein